MLDRTSTSQNCYFRYKLLKNDGLPFDFDSIVSSQNFKLVLTNFEDYRIIIFKKLLAFQFPLLMLPIY